MRLNDLNMLSEMTARTSSLNKFQASQIEDTMKWLKDNGKLTGYERQKPVIEHNDNNSLTLGIVNDDKVTALVNGDHITVLNKSYFQLRVFYCLPEYRRQGDITRLLWFIKHQLKHKIIFYGWQSPDAISLINSIDNINTFKLSWLNVVDGTVEDYKNNDKRSDNEINNWKIVLENDNWIGEHLERWGDTVLKAWWDVVPDDEKIYE
jgi:hypothetical protein